jgi:hypothetical protein
VKGDTGSNEGGLEHGKKDGCPACRIYRLTPRGKPFRRHQQMTGRIGPRLSGKRPRGLILPSSID